VPPSLLAPDHVDTLLRMQFVRPPRRRPRVARSIRVAPPLVLAVPVAGAVRADYRIEDMSLERYELYRGTGGAAPDFDAAPFETFTSLPHTTAALGTSLDDRLVVRFRNRFGLVSQNDEAFRLETDGSGVEAVIRPHFAEFVTIEPWTAGAVRIRADYHYVLDVPEVRADAWAIWITSDGSDPDPLDPETAEVEMTFADGVTRLTHVTTPFSDGLTIKAIVRTRRTGAPDVDSLDTGIVSTTTDVDGPGLPASRIFHGDIAEEGQGG